MKSSYITTAQLCAEPMNTPVTPEMDTKSQNSTNIPKSFYTSTLRNFFV